jgi:hypothetical protein
MLPGEPAEKSNTYVTDINSSPYEEERIAYGDQFLINRYERPFTIEMEDYRGYIDLVLANMKVNPPWIYVEIFLAEELPESSEALYGLEFDTDEDGRGDYLVQAALPPAGEWTVMGVSAYEDADGDVGGEIPLFADEPVEGQEYTGYEHELFRAGVGEDPDLAWVRRHPEDATSLQIALKLELLGQGGFLWVVWADEGMRDPGAADYNDRFSFSAAGSPFPDHQYYPIREINLVDSTCRSWYGFEPVGDEVGICQIYIEPKPGGPNTGWKLCFKTDSGAENCFDTCQTRCPDIEALNAAYAPRFTFFCKPCDLPGH